MSFHTVRSDRLDRLYHWQRLNVDRLRENLRDRVIYLSDPATFNDPWDCKPYFNTQILEDPVENERHVEWAVDICRRHYRAMSETYITNMALTLRADREFAAAKIEEMSRTIFTEISARYRVYCLGPDVGNLLMWAHYADNHKGICLEFNTRDLVMCSALRVQYAKEFPIMRVYSRDIDDNLQIFLNKADVWAYEREYRLIAQERGNANTNETLLTDEHLLQLPETALRSVIVGCQGQYEMVRELVAEVAPKVLVKRAARVPNRFELRITTPG